MAHHTMMKPRPKKPARPVPRAALQRVYDMACETYSGGEDEHGCSTGPASDVIEALEKVRKHFQLRK